MNISIELTLMPLQDNYRVYIIDFIERLRMSGFKIEENGLSTQVFGDYDALMLCVTKELKVSFEKANAIMANMKIVKTDRSRYEPSF